MNSSTNSLFKLPPRFALLRIYVLIFLVLSTFIRLVLFIWSIGEADTSVFKIINTFIIGFLFDIGTVSIFAVPYVIYLLLVPSKFYGNLLDRLITYFAYGLGLIIFIFSFFAEITFWDEFNTRFNFIAVDYLVYTFEVVKNINESYPIPLLLGGVLFILLVLILITKKRRAFIATFDNHTSFKEKIIPSLLFLSTALIFGLFITNKQAEQFENRYNNELAKSGIYSFFAAFRNNDLPYVDFYETIDNEKAFSMVKKELTEPNIQYLEPNNEQIVRHITNSDSLKSIKKPNIILICIESFSGEFLTEFGSQHQITPNLDSIINSSLFFTNLYATGTRTVRGMEAITLSIPPTPGRSIVKRDNNAELFTIGEIFKQQGYENNFFYGGDGYFDNMNSFFGGNGFNIIDRGRGFLLDANIKTKRTNIEDNEVTFENAWGVCDEDIFNKVIKEADKKHETGQPFFDFIMTTSNHRPFTYPENKIDIPSGSGRFGAVKYTDYAIGQFIKIAKTKPWFKNTVFVIMADHCANSAGRWELNINKYHIPALIYNLPECKPQKVATLSSQIDVFPTLFALLNWDYTSNLFGKDILKMQAKDERAFIGNYRKLGLLKDKKLMVLGDQKMKNFYTWNTNNDELELKTPETNMLEEAISCYQVADYLYRHDGLKLKTLSQ